MKLSQYVTMFKADDYALEVLYCYLKYGYYKGLLRSRDVRTINISKKYLPGDIEVYFDHRSFDDKSGLLQLLSFRAIMLDKTINYNQKNDCFIFEPDALNYRWVEYWHLLSDFLKDDEFLMLFEILTSVYCNKSVSEENLEAIYNSIEHLEYRNIEEFAHESAIENEGKVTKDVIGNRAFVLNYEINEYEVPESVIFVGDTAFSYCENLKSIKFNNPNTIFGSFPIIECNNLNEIIVPDIAIDYFREQLPFYSQIIHGVSENKDNFSGSYVPTDLDTSLIKNVFDKKISSYKYLWFWSFLSLAYERKEREIPMFYIAVRLVAFAAHMLYRNQLHFDETEYLRHKINNIFSGLGISSDLSFEEIEEELLNGDKTLVYKKIEIFLRNVPYRFLSPWIRFETKEDVKVKSTNAKYNSPYAIKDKNIDLYDGWYSYFMYNYKELIKFIEDSLAEYIEVFNDRETIKKAFETSLLSHR